MTFRARLALVLIGVLAGPLVAAWVTVGVVVPRQAAAQREQQADQAVGGVVGFLQASCASVRDAATITASALATRRAGGGSVDATAARAAADAAVADRDGVRVVVLAPGGAILATSSGRAEPGAGPATAPEGDLASQVATQLGASCSDGRADRVRPALAQTVPAQLRQGSRRVDVATVVAWQPVTADLLQGWASRLGLPTSTDVALLAVGESGARAVVAATTPSTNDVADLVDLVARGDRPARVGATQAGEAVRTSRTGGGETHVALLRGPSGVPFDVVAFSEGTSQRRLQATLALVLLATSVVAAVLVRLLATRLTQPLQELAAVTERFGAGDLSARTGITGRDEIGRLATSFDTMAGHLEGAMRELREGRDVLADTFERFGEALGRTHDLDGLLHTVLEAAMLGAGGAVGALLLVDGDEVQRRASAVSEDAPAEASAALEDLELLCRRAVADAAPQRGTVAPFAAAALAIPIRTSGGDVIGAVAVGRGPDTAAQEFDASAEGAVTALAAQAGTAVGNVRTHEETRRLSVTDPLTGAGNFRALTTTLGREVERAVRFGRPLSVLMLDLDHFKQVNDSFGHAFGDGVLREFARRLQECLREVDTVARYGGEEFAVVLPETGPEAAQHVAERVVEAVRGEAFRVAGRERVVTVSVGIASFPSHGRSASEVMRAADAALYEAKHSGRDRWRLAPSRTA